jgi:sortase A
MLRAVAERGGSFGRGPAAESSPLGGAHLSRRIAVALIGVLALSGLATFGEGAWLVAKAHLGQWLLHRAWSRTRDLRQPVKPWPWADTHPVARLLAPRLDADVLVLAGASGRTLAWAPGHLDDSAPLGETGNAVVSAHRDTHFHFLRDVAIGDDIVVELADGARRHYRVRERYVADVRRLRLPRTTVVPTLTLVTCYPFDALMPGGPMRFVVVAEATH